MDADAFTQHVKQHRRPARATIGAMILNKTAVLAPFEMCVACNFVHSRVHRCKRLAGVKFVVNDVPWETLEKVEWEQIFSLPADKGLRTRR